MYFVWCECKAHFYFFSAYMFVLKMSCFYFSPYTNILFCAYKRDILFPSFQKKNRMSTKYYCLCFRLTMADTVVPTTDGKLFQQQKKLLLMVMLVTTVTKTKNGMK